MRASRRSSDWLCIVALLALIAAYAAGSVDFSGPPYEDAAMLMRYADHLAHGYGIVWNIGQHPVDGATDFLFMAVSAALIRLGMAVGRSVRAIGLASHVLTVLLVYGVNRRLWRAGWLPSLVSAAYVAVGTGLAYVAAFFGTPFFALFATLTWALALWLMRGPDRAGALTGNPAPRWAAWAFAVSGLVTGLIRPEGVILAALMLGAIVVMRGWRGSASVILAFAAVFAVLGGAYFAWHWSYFGYPLPNPFYKKGAGLLHVDSFGESMWNLLRFAGPFALAFPLGFRSRSTGRLAAAMLIPLLGFAAAFLLISNETNFGGRFQYALWPMVLISWIPLVQGLPEQLGMHAPAQEARRSRIAWLAAALLAAYGLLSYSAQQKCSLTTGQQSCVIAYEHDGRYAVAQMLADFAGRGYTVATSEAGLLPFYSSWNAIDTWGLNDEWIAHHGAVTPQYLDQTKPELIVFHAYFSPLLPPRIIAKNEGDSWFQMTVALKDYAESRGYILAAVFGDSPYETHYYYVRPDFPDSGRIVHRLSTMNDYYWYATGRKAVNYAQVHP